MDWPCDDQPIWLRTRNGKLMSLPYSLEINDSPQLLVRRHTAEAQEQRAAELDIPCRERAVHQGRRPVHVPLHAPDGPRESERCVVRSRGPRVDGDRSQADGQRLLRPLKAVR